MAISVFIQGITLGLSMIIPIGAQNSFLLSQGMRRNHHFLTAAICLICDMVLTLLGIYGGSQLIASNDLLMAIIGWTGITFLLGYAGISLFRAIHGSYTGLNVNKDSSGRKTAVLATLAVTLLNPHVYLDTVIILGNMGSTFVAEQKLFFAAGAIIAAGLWFFGLAAGAARLAPILSKPAVQRGVDVFVAVVMLAVAHKLTWSILGPTQSLIH